MLLQELWLHKINWDKSLPSHMATWWLAIRKDLMNLDKIKIPRWFNTWSHSTVELHRFSDASQLAMSAVIYIVVNSPSTGATSTIICAKTNVAPLKQLTIPRLELTAALLLARLMEHIQTSLKLHITSTHLWTDSQVILTWIKAPASCWKDYVRNRVSQIQELTANAQWRHVPGSSNPADSPSRRITAQQLIDHSLWWTGPPWITQPTDLWPKQPAFPDDSSALEARPGIALFVASPKIHEHWDLINRFSSLNKLLRITALCFKFVARLKGMQSALPVTIISSKDMEAAKLYRVKAMQAAHFSPEIRSLQSNSPFTSNQAFSRLSPLIIDSAHR